MEGSKRKVMKIFWTWIHTITFSLLATVSAFKEITKAGIEIYNDEKLSNVKRKFVRPDEGRVVWQVRSLSAKV